jgi:hypothetical protein
MHRNLYCDVEIPCVAAAQPCIAFFRYANTVAVADPRRDPYVHGLGTRQLSDAAARFTRTRTLLAAAGASGAAAREHHVAADGAYGAGALADEARAGAHARNTGAGAYTARLASRDGDRPLRAVERIVEGERDRVVKVGAALGAGLLLAACREYFGEEIAEGRRVIGSTA